MGILFPVTNGVPPQINVGLHYFKRAIDEKWYSPMPFILLRYPFFSLINQRNLFMSMQVLKRDGHSESIQLDKITKRIEAF